MKKFNKKENLGITLIALVITIVVVIIIAGVAIATLGNNGIIGKANKAKTEQKIASMYEALSIKLVEIQAEKSGKITLDDLDNLNGTKIFNYDTTVTNNSIESPSREVKLKDSSNFEATFVIDANMNIGTNEVEDLDSIATSSTMVQQNFTISNMTGGTFRINVNAVDVNNSQTLYYYVNGECVYSGKQNYYEVTSLSTGPIEDNTSYLVRVYASKYNITVTTGEGDNVNAWLACIGNANQEGYTVENIDALFENSVLLNDLLSSDVANEYLSKSTEKILPAMVSFNVSKDFSNDAINNMICSNQSVFSYICNDSTKFTTAISKPNFRNAMYENASVTETVLQNSKTALDAMKNSSQYATENRYLKNGSYNNSTGTMSCWMNDNTNNTNGIFYNGKAFLLKVSHSGAGDFGNQAYCGKFINNPYFITLGPTNAAGYDINKFVSQVCACMSNNSGWFNYTYVYYFKI